MPMIDRRPLIACALLAMATTTACVTGPIASINGEKPVPVSVTPTKNGGLQGDILTFTATGRYWKVTNQLKLRGIWAPRDFQPGSVLSALAMESILSEAGKLRCYSPPAITWRGRVMNQQEARLVECTGEQGDIAELLVREGWAWASLIRPTNKQYLDAQTEAMREQRGIWGGLTDEGMEQWQQVLATAKENSDGQLEVNYKDMPPLLMDNDECTVPPWDWSDHRRRDCPAPPSQTRCEPGQSPTWQRGQYQSGSWSIFRSKPGGWQPGRYVCK